jgi:hypothetical protein
MQWRRGGGGGNEIPLKKGVRRGRWGWDQAGGGAPRFHMPPICSE